MIFLDLHKTYDALDRYRLLEILEGYGFLPGTCCLLCEYCDRLRMMAHMGGYYEANFKIFLGVIQGNQLPPKILNVVVDGRCIGVSLNCFGGRRCRRAGRMGK